MVPYYIIILNLKRNKKEIRKVVKRLQNGKSSWIRTLHFQIFFLLHLPYRLEIAEIQLADLGKSITEFADEFAKFYGGKKTIKKMLVRKLGFPETIICEQKY